MPVKTYIAVINSADGKRRRMTVVADSPESARAKAQERTIPGVRHPYVVVKLVRLHEGPPR